MLARRLFERVITIGRLRIIDASGGAHEFAGAPGPSAAIRLHDPALHWKLAVRPRLYLPEAFVDGTLTIEEGSLYDLLDLFAINLDALPDGMLSRLLNGSVTLMRRVHQYNPMPRARQNVAHHYDLSDELYGLFLDRDRQYSCAYFADQFDDLDKAQLDAECDAEVTGLTLSVEQHKTATRRAEAAGLSDRVRFHLRDYREEGGRYDRIVSVGMFEHVGINHYSTFFGKLKSLLTGD